MLRNSKSNSIEMNKIEKIYFIIVTYRVDILVLQYNIKALLNLFGSEIIRKFLQGRDL